MAVEILELTEHLDCKPENLSHQRAPVQAPRQRTAAGVVEQLADGHAAMWPRHPRIRTRVGAPPSAGAGVDGRSSRHASGGRARDVVQGRLNGRRGPAQRSALRDILA
jgi:hypothetical protein